MMADLCRYMMYIHCEGQIYMLDRDNSVFSVPQLKFLSRKRKNDHIFETLVDGVSWMYVSIVAKALILCAHIGDGTG